MGERSVFLQGGEADEVLDLIDLEGCGRRWRKRSRLKWVYRLGSSKRQGVWASVEDSILLIGPPRSGKGLHIVIPTILDAPGPVVTTSTRPDNLTDTYVDARTGLDQLTGLLTDLYKSANQPTEAIQTILATSPKPPQRKNLAPRDPGQGSNIQL